MRFGKVIGLNSEGTTGWENSLKYFKTASYIEDDRRSSILFCMPIGKRMLTLLYALGYQRHKLDLKKTYDFQMKYIKILDRLGIWWLSNGSFDFSKMGHVNYYLNGSFESSNISM